MVTTTTWYTLAAAAMGAVTVGLVAAVLFDSRNRWYHALLVPVALVGALNYGLLSVGGGPLAIGGDQFLVVRYLDWLVTVPMLVLYLGVLAGAGRVTLGTAVALATAFVALGLGGAVVGGGARPASYLLAAGAYGVLVLLLSVPMQRAANQRDDRVRALFERLRNLVVVLLALYPVVWALGPYGLQLVNPATEALVVAYLDVLTKGGFAAIAVSNRRALAARLGGESGDVLAVPTSN